MTLEFDGSGPLAVVSEQTGEGPREPDHPPGRLAVAFRVLFDMIAAGQQVDKLGSGPGCRGLDVREPVSEWWRRHVGDNRRGLAGQYLVQIVRGLVVVGED